MIDGQKITRGAGLKRNSDKERVLRIIKKNGRCCVETCQKKANKREGGLCGMHANGRCSHIDINGKQCPNNARIGDLCDNHSKGQCSHTNAEGVKCGNVVWVGGLCGSHARGKCSFDIVAGTKCPNYAVTGGRCDSHGDLSRCNMRHGSLRCVREAEIGCGGFCHEHSNGDAKRRVTRRSCDPTSEILDRMEKDIIRRLKPFMSPIQVKIMLRLHGLRKMLKYDPFQDESFSVNDQLSQLVRELMQELLADDEYQEDVPLRCTNNKDFKTLTVHVCMTLLTLFKGSLRDFGDGGMIYQGKLSEKHVNTIIDETINLLIDKRCPDEDSLFISKAGSGGRTGPAGLASNRRLDPIYYTPELFDPDSFAALSPQLTDNNRGLTERLTASILLGVAAGGNINLPGLVPSTPNTTISRVYLMTSKETSLPKYLARHAIATKGVNAPPGFVLMPAPPPSPITTTTTGTTVGITDVAVSTSADSTTAFNTTGTTGRIADVATPTSADSVQPTQSTSHCGEEVPTPTEHVTSHSRQDEADDDGIDFLEGCLNDGDDCAGQCEGRGERNTSPNTVLTDLSTFDQQNSKATNQGGNNCSKSASETAVINGSTENANGTHKRDRHSESISDDEIGSPPKIPRRPTAGAWQPSNPPANAQDYLAMAQGDSMNLKTNTEVYKRRLSRKLMIKGHSPETLMEKESVIRFVAESRVTTLDEVPEGKGLSQEDCDLIEPHL